MVRLLQWATFLVLILVLVGVALSYPILRERLFAPMLAAPASPVEVLTTQDAMALPTGTTVPTARATVTNTPLPALIIEAPSPTKESQASTNTLAGQAVETLTPYVIATTSLLPANNSAASIVTPVVRGPTVAQSTPPPASEERTNTSAPAPTATTILTASSGIAIPVTPATPTQEAGLPAEEGEKGFEAPPLPTIAGGVTGTRSAPTPTLSVGTVTPIVVTPIVVTTVAISPSTEAAGITPVVAITVELTPEPTPLPLGPTARAESPLYSGPDFAYAIVGQVAIGEQLTIVGIYTEGTWYLLVNGQWIPGAVVDNAPLTLPLVSPTITPVPTNTPTITPTPSPSATPLGSAIPTPTPTSLDQPVCDCSGDSLDCLGNIFANRAQAQQCFEYCFRQTGRDIHLLDPNTNGMACENLP
jgi:hypothetical protein